MQRNTMIFVNKSHSSASMASRIPAGEPAGPGLSIQIVLSQHLDLEQGVALFFLQAGFDEADGVVVLGDHVVVVWPIPYPLTRWT